MVCVQTITNLPLSPCAFHKANILLPCYITLSIPEPSIFFSVSCDHMIYNCDIYNYSIVDVLLLSQLCDLCNYHI